MLLQVGSGQNTLIWHPVDIIVHIQVNNILFMASLESTLNHVFVMNKDSVKVLDLLLNF